MLPLHLVNDPVQVRLVCVSKAMSQHQGLKEALVEFKKTAMRTLMLSFESPARGLERNDDAPNVMYASYDNLRCASVKAVEEAEQNIGWSELDRGCRAAMVMLNAKQNQVWVTITEYQQSAHKTIIASREEFSMTLVWTPTGSVPVWVQKQAEPRTVCNHCISSPKDLHTLIMSGTLSEYPISV